MFINSSSPEALEEYFFKNILNDQYIQKDKLKLHEIPKDVLKLYKEYQGLVIKGSGKHYLAKNNNLILRLDSLLKLDSDLRVLLMFRDPVQHAISLFNQHQSFLSKQKEDPFVQTYMDWLAHHEFGLNHKKMFFDQSEEQSKYTPNQVNYWLENWINYYTYVLNFGGSKQVCFVSFEDYCVFPKQVLSKTVHVLGFDNVGGLSATKPYTPIVVNMVVDKSLKEKAYDLYEKMNEISGFNRKTD